jgi:formate--tetrahydrofolate ligase
VKADIEIAREKKPEPIEAIAEKCGLDKDLVLHFGCDKAKVAVDLMDLDKRKGKLILVTAMSPTPTGEGKTTLAIGLAMTLSKLGHKTIVGLREPSLGPVFGIKGGATGGGYSQVLPMEDINLHFTGDIHAVTSAHNLLSALINNSMHYQNPLDLDSRTLTWPRVIDMNDRSLRKIVVGLGGKEGGMVDESQFDITAASEVMAILCLSKNPAQLKEKLNSIMVGFSTRGEPRYCADLKAAGPMGVLLKDAMLPNLVQTIEHTPAIIHGGPFANIAHGTSSIIAARLGLHLADYYVTEAGFASDLGGEKFFDIFCRVSGMPVAAVVLVATLKSLKYQGGTKKADLFGEDLAAVERGFVNLRRHVENIRGFGYEPVIALNLHEKDSPAEIKRALELCQSEGFKCFKTDVHAKGSEGGMELARAVVKIASEKMPRFAYELDACLKDKLEMLAKKVYKAGSVVLSPEAKKDLATWEELGYGKLPLCVAKTQYSFSDNPKLLGAPEGFELHVSEVRLASGAGFVVPITGEITIMPGLPKQPAAERIDLDSEGRIVGLS